MELAFKTKSLRKLCENEEKAQNKLGLNVTEKLKARLEDLHAAANFIELVAGEPKVVSKGTQQRIVVNLDECYLIEFSANHLLNPVTRSGDIDWSKVRRIKIEAIRIRK